MMFYCYQIFKRFANETNIYLKLTKKILLKSSFFIICDGYSNRVKMAIAIAKEGGIGIIHRNLRYKKQSSEVKKVKNKKLFVGAAIGTNKEDLDRAKSLIANGC